MITKAASAAAVLLALLALAVSLTHAGPRGARGATGAPGPQGNAGQAAQTARLGICWSDYQFTQFWAGGSSNTWVSSVSIDRPQLSDGVYTCPQGEMFVSITPQNRAGQ